MTVCFVYLKGPLFHDAFGSHTFFITNKKPYTFELHAWNRTYYAWMTCKLCWHKNLSIGDWQNKAHSGMATIVCEFGAENCADHVAHDPPWTISTGANNLFVVCHNQGGMLEQKGKLWHSNWRYEFCSSTVFRFAWTFLQVNHGWTVNYPGKRPQTVRGQ